VEEQCQQQSLLERLDVRNIHRTVKQVAIPKGLPPYYPHAEAVLRKSHERPRHTHPGQCCHGGTRPAEARRSSTQGCLSAELTESYKKPSPLAGAEVALYCGQLAVIERHWARLIANEGRHAIVN